MHSCRLALRSQRSQLPRAIAVMLCKPTSKPGLNSCGFTLQVHKALKQIPGIAELFVAFHGAFRVPYEPRTGSSGAQL